MTKKNTMIDGDELIKFASEWINHKDLSPDYLTGESLFYLIKAKVDDMILANTKPKISFFKRITK